MLCHNLSGSWRPSRSSLESRYAHTALREGLVHDLVQPVNFRLARKSKPWSWQRNASAPPPLLVFAPDDTRALPLPLADEIRWTSASRGRVFIFVGDSLANDQANNLLMLAAQNHTHSIENVRRPAVGDGESFHQTSWCRAVCPRVDPTRLGASELRERLCTRDVRSVVCWWSAGKTESGKMRQRTVAHTAAWLLSRLRTLTSRDVIVAAVGPHHHPWSSGLAPLLRQYVAVQHWHATGAWRPRPNASSASSSGGGGATKLRGGGAVVSTAPHAFLRESAPQFWREGVFPGRIGTTTKKHDCLAPWDYEQVQRAHARDADAGTNATAHHRDGNGSSAAWRLEALLGPRAFAAYNRGLCELVAGTSVGLLRVWRPSAYLGSRESYVPRDCTHSYLMGSVYAFWNQLLLHEVWQREARQEQVARDSAEDRDDRSATWMEMRWLLRHPTRHDGTRTGVCVRGVAADGYVPAPAACV